MAKIFSVGLVLFFSVIFASSLASPPVVAPAVYVKVDLGGLSDTEVKKMELEDYVARVVSAEMPSTWPMESLKAQAVAARSYALARIRQKRYVSFDVKASPLDQAYAHKESESAMRAARETSGEILVNQAGEPVIAHYHSDCGGITENAEVVWGGPSPVAPLVKDQKCLFRPSWKIAWTGKKISQRLGFGFPVEAIGILSRSASGRAQQLVLDFSDGSRKVMSAQIFRLKMGSVKLKSTLLEVEKLMTESGFVFRFTGRGFGHGVGMCQTGARDWALAGKTYLQILKHYYPQYEVFSPAQTTGQTVGQNR